VLSWDCTLTAVPPHLPALQHASGEAVGAPAARYCCDGLTRPVLLTPAARCLAVSAFFRKLTGDSRVVAMVESTIAWPSTAIPWHAGAGAGTGWRIRGCIRGLNRWRWRAGPQ
jgi:hypothetical protein